MKTIDQLFDEINDCKLSKQEVVAKIEEFIKERIEDKKEVVPDLSGATEEQKHLIIKELVETTAKAVLTTFIALGLKTHIETMVINDTTGEEFIFKFNKIEN